MGRERTEFWPSMLAYWAIRGIPRREPETRDILRALEELRQAELEGKLSAEHVQLLSEWLLARGVERDVAKRIGAQLDRSLLRHETRNMAFHGRVFATSTAIV